MHTLENKFLYGNCKRKIISPKNCSKKPNSKDRTDVDEVDNKHTVKRSNYPISYFFEKANEIDKPLRGSSKKR